MKSLLVASCIYFQRLLVNSVYQPLLWDWGRHEKSYSHLSSAGGCFFSNWEKILTTLIKSNNCFLLEDFYIIKYNIDCVLNKPVLKQDMFIYVSASRWFFDREIIILIQIKLPIKKNVTQKGSFIDIKISRDDIMTPPQKKNKDKKKT